MTYPGGKNGSGIHQRIINHMPPHDIYIEGFLGSGAVIRHKKPAKQNIGVDLDTKALALTRSLMDRTVCELWHDDFMHFIGDFKVAKSTLIYLDPPYLPSTRKSGDMYDFELTEVQHTQLLNLVCKLPCQVMISGYRSYLYDEFLSDWTRIDYQAQTRRGMVNESLWMNFSIPTVLHDYTYLGDDFRDRERIRRKQSRWVNRFSEMPALERQAIVAALDHAGVLTT